MKVLITGITGFVGRHLSSVLSQQGYSIVGLTRNIYQAQKKLPAKYSLFEWPNPATSLPPAEAFHKVSAVINLAGEEIAHKRWTKKQKQILVDSRVLLTKNLTHRIKQFPSIHTFISASAVGYYGDQGDQCLNETNQPQEGHFLSQLCVDWEKQASCFLPTHQRVVIFRLGLVLSCSGGLLHRILPIFKRNLGGVFGHGDQWMSWIHMEDLTQLLITALKNPSWRGVFNATAPHPITNQEFTSTLAKTLRQRVLIRIPSFVLHFLFGQMASLFLHSQKVKPIRAMDHGFCFQYPNLETCLKSLFK